jgi:glutaminyl-peptide cyclotransferase
MFFRFLTLGAAAVLFTGGCGENHPTSGFNGSTATNSDLLVYTYDVVNVWPHDRSAFTQGLSYFGGELFESTGLNGRSSLRRVDLKTGKVVAYVDVPAQYFAEGLALLGGRLFQLTWRNGKGFVYDLDSFRLVKEFSYDGEGWGLTSDGQQLLMSDGSGRIRFLDPLTFEVKHSIVVLANGQAVSGLNELEYIKDEIYANVWNTDYVFRIDPITGKTISKIDFAGLLSPQDRTPDTDVLNGIAYDPLGDRLFITGKCWPKLFEVRLRPKH